MSHPSFHPIPPSVPFLFPLHASRLRTWQPLLAAIRNFIDKNGGRRPHVLDIGTGTGLLAMMAARGGAAKVTSIEVVPEIAAVARQIVAANGYGDVVTIHNFRRDQLPLELMGERADILVSELIDDHLIGDGVLASHRDARRRLLTPDATIIPWGGKVFAWPLQMRLPSPPGINLNHLHLPRCQQIVISHPYASDKVQRSPKGYHKQLAAPVHLFDFDWASGDLETLCDDRTTADTYINFSTSGTFNAVALYFTMQMDYEPEHDYSAFLDNPGTHWDQPIRFLPSELRVSKGETLKLVARHNDNDIHQIKISGIKPDMHTQIGVVIPKRSTAEKLHIVLQDGW